MLTDSYLPYVSGVTHSIALYRRYLERLGHEVVVLTYGGGPPDPDVIHSPGFRWFSTGYHLGLPLSPRAADALRHVDVMHVHQPFLSGFQAIRHSDGGRRCRVVFTCHSRYSDQAAQYVRAVPGSLRQTVVRRYMPWFCQRVSSIVAPSATTEEWLRQLGVTERVVRVPNAVDIAPFAEAARTRTGPPADDEPLRCCSLGRLAVEKDPFLLLEALARARARRAVTLTFAGDGPLRRELEARVRATGLEDSVTFLGAVPYPEVPRVLAAHHCLVTTSLTEGLPLSLLEAMATGAPVVGVGAPGVTDVVEDDVSGLLAVPDPSAVADALVAAAVPRTWRVLSDGARRRASAFSIEAVGPRMLELYGIDGVRGAEAGVTGHARG